jgi:hypothetical protein
VLAAATPLAASINRLTEASGAPAGAGTVTDYTFNKDEVEDGAPSQGRGESKDAGRGAGKKSQGSPGGQAAGKKKMSNGAKCKALARMQKAFRQDSSQSAKGELTHARFFAELEGSEEKGRWVVAELAMLAKLRAAAADQTPKVYETLNPSLLRPRTLPPMWPVLSWGPGCIPARTHWWALRLPCMQPPVLAAHKTHSAPGTSGHAEEGQGAVPPAEHQHHDPESWNGLTENPLRFETSACWMMWIRRSRYKLLSKEVHPDRLPPACASAVEPVARGESEPRVASDWAAVADYDALMMRSARNVLATAPQ